MGKYFGTDGFRGRANETLTAEQAFCVGRCLAAAVRRGGVRPRIVIGKDTRLSSYMFEYALAAGITASGADAYLLHVTTTPSVAHCVRTEAFSCGVMISASHNPYADNGIKIFSASGEKADEALLAPIEAALAGGSLPPPARGAGIGRTVDFVAGRNRYLAYLLGIPACSFRGFRVGLDCANGSAWALGKAVFGALGADVFLTGAQPDGRNINRGCGSTHPQALQRLVKEQKLDVGFAFDGDADRCLCVDERGRLVDGDGILYLCARFSRERELFRSGVVCTQMSNRGLRLSLRGLGIETYESGVGDRFVWEEMGKRDCYLGGEPSGHVVFRKFATTGDGILTAVKVMETLAECKCPLSVLMRGAIRFPQRVRSVAVRDKEAVMRDDRLQAALFQAEKVLGKGGRLLVRPSGTENRIRLLTESRSKRDCAEAMRVIERAVRVCSGEADVCAGS